MSPAILAELEAVLVGRRDAGVASGSYSSGLVADPVLATRKVMEEAYELSLELTRPEVDRARAAAEAADLLFHVLAGMVGARVPLADVLRELEARRR